MRLIVGLGNPGKEYELTRHNAGFLALDYVLKDLAIISCASKFKAKICEVRQPDKTLYVYPQTFMNNSGAAVGQIAEFYKILPEDILIIHDDVDLPLGVYKLAKNSGAAGHKGVQSVIDSLGTQEFRRLRIGIESREDKSQPPTDAFVLQKFSAAELELLPFRLIKEELKKSRI